MEALSGETQRPRPAAQPGGALVLIGFMGAGKTSGARSAAAELGVQALDSDRVLERQLGESIESFFDREGEEVFRQREEQLIVEMLEGAGDAIVSLGGGATGSDRVREAMDRHTVVHLEVDAHDAWHRATGKGRPLARDRTRFDQLHADRTATYAAAAHATLPPGGREGLRRALPSLLALRAARTSGHRSIGMVWARARSGDYPVYFGRGIVAGGFLPALDGRLFAVTDTNVAGRHSIAAHHTIEIAPGEEHKTLAAAESILRELASSDAERGDILAAVGGGVVGDITGFCAAIYQRGMRHIQVPTTLVAQVDSAYGGKTGVDLPEGKNYAGAYHQPSAVVCDPDLLDTLPAAERAAGYAEVVKTALIAGGQLWARVRAGGEPDEATIVGCLRTKLTAVTADERDAGRRQVLNLGHTVGHAIESATAYARYRHGEAVGIGLLAALRLSDREGLRAEVAELLSSHGLPTSFDGAEIDAVAELCQRDKKRVGGRVPFVLVQAPGEVTPGHEITPGDLRDAIAEVHV